MLKQLGFCVDCGQREAIEHQTRCGVCAEAHEESKTKFLERRFNENRCLRCGALLESTTYFNCAPCRKKDTERKRKPITSAHQAA